MRRMAGMIVGVAAVLAAAPAFGEGGFLWSGREPEPATSLAGTWSSVEGTTDVVLTLEAGGSGSALIYDHATDESTTLDLSWVEESDHLRTTAEGRTEQRYLLERIGVDAFRSAGGNLGLDTQLYRRVESAAGMPTAWFVGTWAGSPVTLVLEADGRYRATQSGGSTEAGTWRAEPGTLAVTPDGAPTITYQTEVTGGGQLNLTGGNLEGYTLFLNRSAMPGPGDPLAGQFVGGDMTLVLERRAGGIAASGVTRGLPFGVDTRLAEDGTLLLSFPDDAGGDQAVTPFYNGVTIGNGYSSTWLEKQAELPLPVPDGLVGEWLYPYWDGSSSAYAFLADGRYVATYTSGGGGEPLVTNGTYSRDEERLVLDPECEGPAEYAVQLGGPQLVLGSGIGDPSTHHFVPDSPATLAAAMAARDAAWAAEDASWEEGLALAPAAPGAPVTPSSEVPVDPAPQEVFTDATVFAAPQVYLWQSDYFYVQMMGETGLLYSISNAELIFNDDLAARIDWSRGQHYDSIKLFFYPNGRMFQRIENYAGARVQVGAVIPTVTTAWGRYRVEGDAIVSDDETIELLHGRRRARSAEMCLDSLAWMADRE
jgi:hypothetical protein